MGRVAALILAFAGAPRLAGAQPMTGRVAEVEGAASIRPAGAGAYVAVRPGAGTPAGTILWTGETGRIAVRLGGVEARLEAGAGLQVAPADPGRARLALDRGSADVRILDAGPSIAAVVTAAGVASLAGPGLYRIDVPAPADGESAAMVVTVFEGEALVATADDRRGLGPGDAIEVRDGHDPAARRPEVTAIDDWGQERDVRQAEYGGQASDPAAAPRADPGFAGAGPPTPPQGLSRRLDILLHPPAPPPRETQRLERAFLKQPPTSEPPSTAAMIRIPAAPLTLDDFDTQVDAARAEAAAYRAKRKPRRLSPPSATPPPPAQQGKP